MKLLLSTFMTLRPALLLRFFSCSFTSILFLVNIYTIFTVILSILYSIIICIMYELTAIKRLFFNQKKVALYSMPNTVHYLCLLLNVYIRFIKYKKKTKEVLFFIIDEEKSVLTMRTGSFGPRPVKHCSNQLFFQF